MSKKVTRFFSTSDINLLQVWGIMIIIIIIIRIVIIIIIIIIIIILLT